MDEKKDKLGDVFSSIIQERKEGRPVKKKFYNTGNIDNTKKPIKPENSHRIAHTYKYEKDVVEKIKAYAYWKRSDISDVVNAVLKVFIQAAEKEEGPIKPIPTEPIQPVKSIKVG